MIGRDTYVVEGEARRLVTARTHLVLDAQQLEAGCIAFDEERTMAVSTEGGIDGGPHHDPIGTSGVRAEHLRAGEHPLLAVATRSSGDARHVAARSRLGERHRTPMRARMVGERFEEAVALFRRGRAAQRGATETRPGQREVDAAIPIGALLADEQRPQRLPREERLVGVVLADQFADETALPGADQVQGVVDGWRIAGAIALQPHRSHVLATELAHLPDQLATTRVELDHGASPPA